MRAEYWRENLEDQKEEGRIIQKGLLYEYARFSYYIKD
jgi:hypothetical protein